MKSFQGESRLLQPPSRWWLVLCVVLLLAGVGFLGVFGYEQYGYLKSSRYYDELAQLSHQSTGEQSMSSIDFAALEQINPDIAAWLEMPGLPLSLPVVQAQDNDTYLHHSFDGSPSPCGCLFFSASSADSDLYRVIYGHNIHTGEMFAGLLQYQEESFYRENPDFVLCTPEGDQTCTSFPATAQRTARTCTAPTAPTARHTTPSFRNCPTLPTTTPGWMSRKTAGC